MYTPLHMMHVHALYRDLQAHLRQFARPLVVVLGPTASGKTASSIEICEYIASDKEGGWMSAEVINADSRQLYRGLDIGTAKITSAEARGIVHHLIDVLDPQQPANIGWYQEHAMPIIDDCIARRCVPMLVGGSMLYLSAIIDGLQPLPSVEPSLRTALEQELAKGGAVAMHRRLSMIDPEAAATVDPRNGIYLIRALELAEVHRQPLSTLKSLRSCSYDLFIIGIHRPREELVRRINERTSALFAAGWVEEVAGLLTRGVRIEDPAMQSHGYREIAEALGKESRSMNQEVREGAVNEVKNDTVLMERISANTRRYAKRQQTWWRGNERIRWVTQ